MDQPLIRLGTSAFTAYGWEGSLYLEELTARDQLSYSAQHFHTDPAMPRTVPEWVKAYGQWLYDRSGGWAFDQAVPQILYKYYRAERLHVLRDCSLRFSQRAVFDDDRELRPDVAAFGTEEEIRTYLRFNPWGQKMSAWLREAMVQLVLNVPGWQSLLTHIAQSNISAAEEFAMFCLCEEPNSNEMWDVYAGTTGFVIAFDTTHPAFEALRNPGKLGRITYSDAPLGTFLGSYGPEAFFRKRLKYAFEREWRVLRAIYHLKERGEHDGHHVFVSQFDPACVHAVLLRPENTVEDELRALFAADSRYAHIALRRAEVSE